MVRLGNEQVLDLNGWFIRYVQGFKNDPATVRNIVLKEEHTKRVCREIIAIGTDLGLTNDELHFAEIIALFHDIGRFEQYARYKTFVDRRSEDHAELGVTVLRRLGVLHRCGEATQDLVFRIIRYHNRAALPRDETEPCLFFSKLLRDADKLDIWRVVTDYYRREDGERNGALELDLPDTPGFSDAVYLDLMRRKIVDMKHVMTLNDFKLLQIGWIFDVNFRPTLLAVRSRGYLEMIRHVLPKSEKIDALFSDITEYLEERLTPSKNIPAGKRSHVYGDI